MTYEEMELFLFDDNTDPIPGSWRDEAVKLGMLIETHGDIGYLPAFATKMQQARRKMLDNIGKVVMGIE